MSIPRHQRGASAEPCATHRLLERIDDRGRQPVSAESRDVEGEGRKAARPEAARLWVAGVGLDQRRVVNGAAKEDDRVAERSLVVLVTV